MNKTERNLIRKIKRTVAKEIGIPEDYIDEVRIFPVILDNYLWGDCIILEDMNEIEFKINHRKQVEIVDKRPLIY